MRIKLRNEPVTVMKSVILLILLFFTKSCGYGPITGTVMDAETGTPIEGAVVLIEWTKTGGLPGLTNTKSFKVIEKLTDKDGKFYIEGLSDTSVNKPDMTIYRKGYVAWNNQYIFPGDKKRTDFKWKNGGVYSLEKFDEKKHTYEEHTFFIHNATHASMGNKEMISEAYRWEELRASKERDETWHKKLETLHQ